MSQSRTLAESLFVLHKARVRRTETRLTRSRLSHHALAVLEAAHDRGFEAPTPLTPADRLAIGWLLFVGVAEQWQAEFWAKALTTLGDHGMDGYCRKRDLAIYLNRWRAVIADRDRTSG